MRNDLTARYVRSILRYDARKGQMFWRVNRGRARIGMRAGRACGSGYRYIQIDGVNYLEHRLVWLHVKGRWPRRRLDHRDVNPLNNRFGNLRNANLSQNNANSHLRSDNSSGSKGVYWSKSHSKWQVQIQIRRRKIFLGRFSSRRRAGTVYIEAAIAAFGEFARAA